MRIRYGCELSLAVERPTPAFCIVDVHPERRADISEESPLRAHPHAAIRTGHDGFGNRLARLTLPPGPTTLRLSGLIASSSALDPRDDAAAATIVTDLPEDVLTYLNGSRYCETDKLGTIAWSNFGNMQPGSAMVAAICDFTHERLTFDYSRARATRTAMEGYEERAGVCRDFAHLAIALCRCMNIPARYVNGYLGDIGVPPDGMPMDFSAWFEVYLAGAWFTFDARHNQRRIGRIPIARGRDACDVPMIQTFGPHRLAAFAVTAEEVVEASPLPLAAA